MMKEVWHCIRGVKNIEFLSHKLFEFWINSYPVYSFKTNEYVWYGNIGNEYVWYGDIGNQDAASRI